MAIVSDKKLDRLTTTWKKKITRYVPEGMVVEGVVSGGKGISHRTLFVMLGVVVGLTLLLGIGLKLAGVPGIVAILAMAVFPNVIIPLAVELGIYRSIFIFWDKRQVVIIEGGAFDRLLKRQFFTRPLVKSVSWVAPGTVVIGDWKIHLDYPGLCREMLNRALEGMENDGMETLASDAFLSGPETGDVSVGKGMRSRVMIAAWVCIVIGFAGWFGAFLCNLEEVGRWPFLGKIPLPVGPAQVVADLDGNFYLISKFYSRIQKYNPRSGFAHGWHLSTHKGDHSYLVDKENRLHVFVRRKNTTNYYLDEERGIVLFDSGESGSKTSKTSYLLLPQYEYNWWYLAPSVVSIDHSGRETVVMRTPFWLWPFTAPAPAFLLVLIGIAVAIFADPDQPTGR